MVIINIVEKIFVIVVFVSNIVKEMGDIFVKNDKIEDELLEELFKNFDMFNLGVDFEEEYFFKLEIINNKESNVVINVLIVIV